MELLEENVVHALKTIDANRSHNKTIPRTKRLKIKKLTVRRASKLIGGIIIIIANGIEAPPGIREASITIGGVIVERELIQI